MTLELHLTAPSIDELRIAAVTALGLDPLVTVVPAETAPTEKTANVADAKPDPTNESETKPEPAKKPDGRLPKAKAKAEPKAKVEVKAEEPKKLSRDSVRHVFDLYVNNFGLGAAQIDGPILLKRVCGDGVGRIADVPEDDQVKLGRIVAAVEMAIAKNEFDRKSVKEAAS